MIGFGGYLAGWALYILAVFGLYYFSLRFIGRWRNLLFFKLLCSFGAALLLTPWHIQTAELDYWVPAAVAGFIDGVSNSPDAVVEYLVPIALLSALFWLIAIARHFIKKRKHKIQQADLKPPAAGSKSV